MKGYDAYREALSKDPNLNKEYQDYMKQLIDNQGTYNVPQVSDDYLAEHERKEHQKLIKNEMPNKIHCPPKIGVHTFVFLRWKSVVGKGERVLNLCEISFMIVKKGHPRQVPLASVAFSIFIAMKLLFYYSYIIPSFLHSSVCSAINAIVISC
ncbi:hypothetical protein SAMN04488168_10360 [Bacillus sp. 491mf]|nr:hypothetical protein SAMN04488168_10360 [Bacillus sp. 491mf]